MKILKKTYSQNNNEIVLVESASIDVVGLESPTYIGATKTILIIGVVHGDEPQGKFLIENYLDNTSPLAEQREPLNGGEACDPVGAAERVREVRFQCEQNLRTLENGVRGNSKSALPKNRLLFIPCLNPDGLELQTRQNANEIDINRNFPTENWVREPFTSEYFGGESASSEIETKFVVEVIEEFSPDVILTLHAPYKVVNYDGPAEEIAEEISKIINYPTSKDIGYPTPGSFGTYSGVERNIPTITLELDEEIDVKELITPINKIFDYLTNC